MLPTANTAPITTASQRPIRGSRYATCACIVENGKQKRGHRLGCPELLRQVVTIYLWHVAHQPHVWPRRRALATVAAEIRPVMHGPILLALIIGLGVAGVVLARL